MVSDWILGPALAFIGAFPLAVARAELWRLRTAAASRDSGSGDRRSLWIALLGAALVQFIAVAALMVDRFGQRRTVAFEIVGVLVCIALLGLRAGRETSLSALSAVGIGFALGLLTLLLLV